MIFLKRQEPGETQEATRLVLKPVDGTANPDSRAAAIYVLFLNDSTRSPFTRKYVLRHDALEQDTVSLCCSLRHDVESEENGHKNWTDSVTESQVINQSSTPVDAKRSIFEESKCHGCDGL